VRVAALADLHGHFPAVPDCDVLAIAGDIVLFNPDMSGMSQALDLRRQLKQFADWLEDLFSRNIFVLGVAGNHDFPFAEMDGYAASFAWTYLQDDAHVREESGHIFYGSPWQPWMGGWAFNAPESDLDDPDESWLDEKFGQIPTGTDVLITHTPPAGFHDTVKGAHRGSISLNKHIERVRPKLVIYGHIHKPGVEQVEGITLCNAAYVNFRRQPNGHPIQVFDL
jgi:Icc-related predicted phosphoesterase